MSSVARICVLALLALLHLSTWQAAWSIDAISRQINSYQVNGGTPGDTDPPCGTDAPSGTMDERLGPMADDIFEIAALPDAAPSVRAVAPDGRAGLAPDELRRGRSAPDTPDKPPRA